MQRSLVTTAIAIAALGTVAPASAQFRNAEEAIKYRQSVMFVQNYHLGRLFAMVNGRIPFDAKAAVDHAVVVDTVDHQVFPAFIDNSTGGNSRAKPTTWTERAKFDAIAVKLQEESAKMVTAARSGSLDQLRPAVGAVATQCKACHDQYRAE